MKKITPILLLVVSAFIVSSCGWFGAACLEPKIICICKFKGENTFAANIPVGLSDDKSYISCSPGPNIDYQDTLTQIPPHRKQYELEDHYFINYNMAACGHTAYLSLTWFEYSYMNKLESTQSMMDSIIESDPFLEVYVFDDQKQIFGNLGEIGHYGSSVYVSRPKPDQSAIDHINSLILEGKLEKYFKRLK